MSGNVSSDITLSYWRISQCGDGVPVAKKSRFHSFATDAARILTGAHVVIQARTEADVDSALIMKRVAEAGGAKYSTHQEKPQRMERPAPVGTNYTPVGRPDIASMTSNTKKEAPAAVGTTWTPRHNELNEIRQNTSKPAAAAPPPVKQPEAPAAPPRVPTAPRPTVRSHSRSFSDCMQANIGVYSLPGLRPATLQRRKRFPNPHTHHLSQSVLHTSLYCSANPASSATASLPSRGSPTRQAGLPHADLEPVQLLVLES